jgi:hypothetical protein
MGHTDDAAYHVRRNHLDPVLLQLRIPTLPDQARRRPTRHNKSRSRSRSPEDHEVIVHEIYDIRHQLEEEQEATMGQGVLGILREMFCMPNNAYRLYLGLGVQLLSQWSGAGSITIYAADFFALLGTKGQNEKLFATAIFGVVKFVAAIMCALFLVDVIGRKRALTIGISLQALAMAYIASFLTAVPNLEEPDFVFTSAQKHASIGAIVMIYVSGFGWAMGWNSIQYLVSKFESLSVLQGFVGLTFLATRSTQKSTPCESELFPAPWSCASTSSTNTATARPSHRCC